VVGGVGLGLVGGGGGGVGAVGAGAWVVATGALVVGTADTAVVADALGFTVEDGLLDGLGASMNGTRAPSTFPGKLVGVTKSPPS
jgi:hypothetical protein